MPTGQGTQTLDALQVVTCSYLEGGLSVGAVRPKPHLHSLQQKRNMSEPLVQPRRHYGSDRCSLIWASTSPTRLEFGVIIRVASPSVQIPVHTHAPST